MPDCKASDDGKVYIRGLVWYREAAGATGERRRVPTFAALQGFLSGHRQRSIFASYLLTQLLALTSNALY